MEHERITIQDASEIAIDRGKTQIAIIAWDPEAKLTDVVTWGRTAHDKALIASAGDRLRKMLDLGEPVGDHEDFRTDNYGSSVIAAERRRQIEVEGYHDEHDDGHDNEELALAAVTYLLPDRFRSTGDILWPWAPGYDKREKHNRRRRLEIAGAWIAAELDRLRRLELKG